MPRVEIPVDGMTCEHCEISVTAALRGAGATEAEADSRRGRASADFDGDPSVLIDAIGRAGYGAGPIDAGTREAELAGDEGRPARPQPAPMSAPPHTGPTTKGT